MLILYRFSDRLGRFVSLVGSVVAWLSVLLIVVIAFDVITRRFLVLGSTKLQELEWHLHAVLFLLCIGWGYMKDTHVRIEILHERLPRKAQLWIELLGCLFFLIPYCVVVFYHGTDWWEKSWNLGEMSDSATGLPHRWIIKAFLPIGIVFIFLAAVSVFLRKFVELFGSSVLPETAGDEPATSPMRELL